MSGLMREIIDSNFKMEASDFLNRKDYIDWEYTFDILYVPSLFSLRNQISVNLDSMIEYYDYVIMVVHFIGNCLVFVMGFFIYRTYLRSI